MFNSPKHANMLTSAMNGGIIELESLFTSLLWKLQIFIQEQMQVSDG